MKYILITIIALSSFSAFADFVCIKHVTGDPYLITSGKRQLAVSSIDECQKAVNASKNGFVCLQDKNGSAYLFTTGEQYMAVPSIEECQKAINVSK